MKHCFSVIALIVFIGFFGANQVSALTLSPVKSEISGAPGELLRGEMILSNEEKIDRTFYSSFQNFEAQGDTGSPKFIPGATGLAVWINTASTTVLHAGERKVISYTIQIPANAEAGGYFSAIFWSTTSPDNQPGGQLGIGAKVGTLILLTVTGVTKDGASDLEFSSTNKQRVFQTLPLEFTIKMRNGGADRVIPQGEIKIKNLFGFTKAVIPVNQSRSNVLPNQTRRFTATWTGKQGKTDPGNGFFGAAVKEWRNFGLGYYRAQIDVKYGANAELKSHYFFFMIPWQLLLIEIIILFTAGFGVYFGLKKYNQWIVTQAAKKASK